MRSPLFRHLSLLLLALGLVLAPGCKKGKGTKGPGGRSKAEVEAAIKKAKEAAKSQSLVDLANQDLEKGRYVSATKRADEALEANPDNPDAHAILGAARWRAGDFEASTSAFRKALELDEKNFGANLGLARNLQASGQHAEAAKLGDVLLGEDKKQVDPMLAKLWSYYSLCDADKAVETLDAIFQNMPPDDPQLPLVQAYAGFVRPLEGKGKLCEVSGKSGKSDLQLDLKNAFKHSGGVVGGEFVRVVFLELREESIIDKKLAKKLKLEELGKFKPPGQDEERGVVIVPEIKFGDLSLKNVPAIVQDLSAFEAALGDTPGMILGRQAMHPIGAITFDFPKYALELSAEAPKSAPADAAEVPFLLVSMHVLNAPAIPISVGESKHKFYAYFGGIYTSGVTVSRKHYLKSDNLPRTVEEPEDPENGWKMVYVPKIKVGDKESKGMGGLVLTNTPPDANLGTLVQNTAFELGGYVNLALVKTWRVTFSLSTGKAYLSL